MSNSSNSNIRSRTINMKRVTMNKMSLYYGMDDFHSLKGLKPQKRKDNKEVCHNEKKISKGNKEGEKNK